MARGTGRIEATFCFVDVAGFTALTEAHGDDAAADLIEHFQSLVVDSIAMPGRLLDAIGDAVLVMHPHPEQAISFAAHLFARVNSEPDFPALRAGLHHGPVVERGGKFFGATLNLAARVAAQAHGGQVLATAAVAEAAHTRGVEVAGLGAFTLRNVRDPVEIFALNCAAAATEDVTDPVCRMRVRPERAAGRLRHNGVDYWFCSLSCAARFAESPEAYARVSGGHTGR